MLAPETRLVSEKHSSITPDEKTAESSKPADAEAKPEVGKASAPEQECTLSGDKLFLIDAVSSDPDFASSITVPDGFVEASLVIPAPKGKTLYLKLRDDPTTVDTAVLPVTEEQR